jgi:hypothetical protein
MVWRPALASSAAVFKAATASMAGPQHSLAATTPASLARTAFKLAQPGQACGLHPTSEYSISSPRGYWDCGHVPAAATKNELDLAPAGQRMLHGKPASGVDCSTTSALCPAACTDAGCWVEACTASAARPRPLCLPLSERGSWPSPGSSSPGQSCYLRALRRNSYDLEDLLHVELQHHVQPSVQTARSLAKG